VRFSFVHIGGLRENQAASIESQAIHPIQLVFGPTLREERIICLRLLCVSSAAATFIDLTDQENIESILDSHRIDDGRIYKTELLSLSQKNGYAVSPKPWDVIVFDANTPHIPPGALQSNRRVFQQAWIEIQLPPDWRPRLRSDNRPLFMFPDF
jgi:hypothetical protein